MDAEREAARLRSEAQMRAEQQMRDYQQFQLQAARAEERRLRERLVRETQPAIQYAPREPRDIEGEAFALFVRAVAFLFFCGGIAILVATLGAVFHLI